MGESREIPSEGVQKTGALRRESSDSARDVRKPGQTLEAALIVGGAKAAVLGGEAGWKVGKGLSKFAVKETAKTLWQAWKHRRDLAMAGVGATAAVVAMNPDKSLDVVKSAAYEAKDKAAVVLKLDHKMPSEVEYDRLTGKEVENADFFELTFPWLNEAEKLEVRTLADTEKEFLANYYPEGTVQKVHELTPLIKETADRYGVPYSYLRGIVFVESAGNPSAVNDTSGAAGLTQIMPETAVGLGYEPDDRFDPRKNLEMAAIYLRDFHQQTGLWAEDVAIFHTGAGNWDYLKRLAFENKGIAIPTVVTDENAQLNATIQRESTFHNKIGPIQVILDKEVEDIIAADAWNNHGKYLLRVFAAEELVHEYEKNLFENNVVEVGGERGVKMIPTRHRDLPSRQVA